MPDGVTLGSARGEAAPRQLGEAAARRALCRLGLPRHVEFRREPSGAVRALLGPVPLPLWLSVSHAGGRAVAAASRRARVGVDLLHAPLSDEGLWGQFFAASERVALSATSRDALGVGFSAKEAAWKAFEGDGPSELGMWNVLAPTDCGRGRATGGVATRLERGPRAGEQVRVRFWSWPSRGGRVTLCLEEGAA